MREVVGVHLGQAGVGVGGALWQHLAREQGAVGDAMDHTVFFEEREAGGLVPRAVFGDLDPEVMGGLGAYL